LICLTTDVLLTTAAKKVTTRLEQPIVGAVAGNAEALFLLSFKVIDHLTSFEVRCFKETKANAEWWFFGTKMEWGDYLGC
jgi:hypothetical protein